MTQRNVTRLATDPRVLPQDEPLAGLGARETARVPHTFPRLAERLEHGGGQLKGHVTLEGSAQAVAGDAR